MTGGPDMIMGYWQAWHWILFVASLVVVLYPIGRILSRIGFSPFWSLVALIPPANLIGLWVVALGTWPRDEKEPR